MGTDKNSTLDQNTLDALEVLESLLNERKNRDKDITPKPLEFTKFRILVFRLGVAGWLGSELRCERRKNLIKTHYKMPLCFTWPTQWYPHSVVLEGFLIT